MADLSIPNTVGGVISAAPHNQNYSAIQSYINARNSGSSTWDNVSALQADIDSITTSNVKFSGDLTIGGGKPWADVKSYGAVGDGVTDDYAAIQSALNSGAKKVYIPEGNYICSSTLTINANTCFFGDGPKLSVIKFTHGSSNGIEPVLTGDLITIKGLKLYSTGGSTGWAIFYEEVSDAMREMKIDDFEVEGFKNGFRLSYLINGFIGSGRMIGTGPLNDGIGIHLGNYPDNGIYGTTISKTYISTYKFGYKGSLERSLLMLNPIIEGCWYPIHSEANGKITIVSPYFENNSTSYKLVVAEGTTDISSGITIINPFVWNSSSGESDFESRVEGPRISIIYSGRDTVEQWGDDSIYNARSYSTDTGHSGILRFFKSNQTTKGLTATADNHNIGQVGAYGVNSSSAEATVANIIMAQSGASGASHIAGTISMKVGTNALTPSTAFQVKAPADGEVGILVQRNDGGSLTLQRVGVGIANSGGTGYRLLRILN